MANKKRIDLLNNSALDTRLCHKHSDIEIQSSLASPTDRQFAFRDPFIKEQLKNFTLNCEATENSILPATLLDYICCKRLEDNYNFYMDNIIRYVQHTIEQLKRISNGDYLTDRAKEKWRNVDDTSKNDENNNMKVLATSTSIPLRVERKACGSMSSWDDIVHSEADVRSLSKILEKKIVVEIPKIICGSFKIISKTCANNLFISCNKQSQFLEEEDSRVDVVLKLERSKSGQVISNINSIMVLQIPKFPDTLALTYNKKDTLEYKSHDDAPKVVEVDQVLNTDCENIENSRETIESSDIENEDLSNDTRYSKNTNDMSDSTSIYSSVTQSISDVSYNKTSTSTKSSHNFLIPKELMVSMRNLDIQSLAEETGEEFPSDFNSTNINKKRSPTRVRIKSPYENKSYVLEEKKRKRLLEIREKREKRKMAMGEGCKVNKHKYSKGAIMPQPSNSVTKLSITNKSFYNSIYGHAVVLENNQQKGKNLKSSPNNSISNIPLGRLGEEQEIALLSSERNTKKYINRSFYLDDTETEMMYVDTKAHNGDENETNSTYNTIALTNFVTNYNVLSETNLSCSSIPNLAEKSDSSYKSKINQNKDSLIAPRNNILEKDIQIKNDEVNAVPTNSPNSVHGCVADRKKSSPTLECRRSIDKIYDLIPKLNKETSEKKIDVLLRNGKSESSTFQESDSGTSLKHQITSSNPSSYSLPKNEIEMEINKSHKNSEAIIPRVVISSKSQLPKYEGEKCKKNKKVVINPVSTVTDNPLKAISQLLHEIENIQITNKDKTETKMKKQELANLNVKNNARQTALKGRSRIDQPIKVSPQQNSTDKVVKVQTPASASRRPKPLTELSKNQPQALAMDKGKIENSVKKKLVDIIDEAKEARGEAVRGPPKFNSRLNTLAQPKKSYIQAHNEEYNTKYGRNITGDRLHRLAATPNCTKERIHSANLKNKPRCANIEGTLSVSAKAPSVPPLDRAARARRSTSCSPENIALRQNTHHNTQAFHIVTGNKTTKKMGDVESYVHTHFRNDTRKSAAKPMIAEQRSRVPLVPKDIDLDSLTSMNSLEESSKLGSKLHHLIDGMFHNSPPALSVLSEGLETSFMSKSDVISYNENKAMIDEKTSLGSDYPIGVLEDTNIVTAVEKVEKKDIAEAFYTVEPIDSGTQVDLLEKELYKQISSGTFKKNLRLKKLTLSPKQSLKQMIVLQSGDDGSLGAESLLSQSLKMKSTDKSIDLKLKPVLSKLQIDWDCLRFPMKITTIGYALPIFNRQQFCSELKQSKFIKGCREANIDNIVRFDSRQLSIVQGANHQYLKHHCDSLSKLTENNTLMDAVNVHCHDRDKETLPVSSEEIDYLSKQDKEKMKNYIDKNDITCHAVEPSSSVIPLNTLTINKFSDGNNDTEKAAKISPEREIREGASTEADIVDNTSSLDILVNLLNEIQKISECQTHMTKDNREHESKESVKKTDISNQQGCDKYFGKQSALTRFVHPRDVKSQPSIYTFYLNTGKSDRDTDDQGVMGGVVPKSNNKNDKGIIVDVKEYCTTSRLTDAPSIFRIATDHGTNITESFFDMFSQSSNHSLISFKNKADSQKHIVRIPLSDNTCLTTNRKVNSVQRKNKLNLNLITKCNEFKMNKNTSVRQLKSESKGHSELLTENAMMEFDPMIKMKRDILVTFYSILAITVFAALSLPEVLNV
ncbi:uncharacterized protein LOC101739407 isoform X2 [Bombyx mori]